MIYCMLICCKDILSALRWFSFIFRAGSLCPDTIGPQGHDRWLELMQGMPTLDFANVAGHVQRVFAAEPSDLWALVREACSVSVLLALTAFSAALQRRVGLLGPEAQAASLAEAWGAFGGVLGELLGRVGRARALTDATGVPLLAPEDVVRIWSGWMGFQARDSGLEVAEQALEQAQGASGAGRLLRHGGPLLRAPQAEALGRLWGGVRSLAAERGRVELLDSTLSSRSGA